MSSTTRLAMPRIAASQAQKHVTHNDALEIIDALVHLSVESRTVASPPAPAAAARYLVPADASGAWAGHGGEIAVSDAGAWTYHKPQAGWRAFVRDEAQLTVFDGTAWAPLLRRTPSLGINAEADSNNRLSVSSPAALFNHAGADMRLVLNKAAATNVGALHFQTGFVTQAELGLSGDNDLRIKVKDGTTMRQAMVVKSGTGRVGIGVAEPAAELEIADTSGDGDCRIQLRANATQVAQFGASSTQVFVDTSNEKPFLIYINGMARARFDSFGNVGIGVSAPSARLDVDGPIRTRPYTRATLPNPVTSGPGTVVFISDETGGSVLAFSDGVMWRRVTDRAAIA